MTFKRIIRGLGLLCFCLPFMALAVPAAKDQVTAAAQSDLTIHIKGIRSDRGKIKVALFRDRASYDSNAPNAQSAYRRAQLPIKNGAVDWNVEIPYGVYAVKLFHDEDNSGQLKKSFIGRPQEGVGFSNNPKLGNHAPTFDEVRFQVGKPQVTIVIQMINP